MHITFLKYVGIYLSLIVVTASCSRNSLSTDSSSNQYTAKESTGLQLVNFSPQDGSEDVSVSSPILLRFSETVTTDIINSRNFTVKELSTGKKVTGKLDVKGNVVKFLGALGFSKQYIVSFTPPAGSVNLALAQNSLRFQPFNFSSSSGTFSFKFKTGLGSDEIEALGADIILKKTDPNNFSMIVSNISEVACFIRRATNADYTYKYQWRATRENMTVVDTIISPLSTNNKLSLSKVVKNRRVVCDVFSYYKGSSEPTIYTADDQDFPVEFMNTQPGNPAVPTIFSNYSPGGIDSFDQVPSGTANKVTCSMLGSSTDADGDTIYYKFDFHKNGQTLPFYTVNDVAGPNPFAEVSNVGSVKYSRGDVLTCTVTATDKDPYFNANSLVATSDPLLPVTVINYAPSAPASVSIASNFSDTSLIPPQTANTVTCTVGTPYPTDPDTGDVVNYIYEFTRNRSGVITTLETSSATTATSLSRTYNNPAFQYERGDSVSCAVIATDTNVNGNSAKVASSGTPGSKVDVINTAPNNPNVPTIVSNYTNTAVIPVGTGNSVTCATSAVTDDDGDTVSYLFTFYLNGSSTAFHSSPAQATPSYAIQNSSFKTPYFITNNDQITCGVQATDQLTYNPTSALVKSSAIAPVTVLDRPPGAITNVDISSNFTVTTQIPKNGGYTPTFYNLTCTLDANVSDPDGEAVSYAYRFYKLAAPATAIYTASSNAPTFSATVTGTSALVTADEIGCEVTATSGGLSVSANSVDDASTPAKQKVTVIDRAPGSIANVDIVSNYTNTAEIPRNGGGSNLICSINAAVTDPDGDTLSYTYRIYKLSAPATTVYTTTSALLTYTVAGTNALSGGDELACEVTATGGASTSVANSENTASTAAKQKVTVINRAPTAPASVSIASNYSDTTLIPPLTANTVTCTVGTTYPTDPDGDTVNYIYEFTRNRSGTITTLETSSATTATSLSRTYNNPAFMYQRGDSLSCAVIATDTFTNGQSAKIASSGTPGQKVDVINTAPNNPNVPTFVSNNADTSKVFVTNANTATCSTSAVTDPDGDTVSYIFNFYKNGNSTAFHTSTAQATPTYGLQNTGIKTPYFVAGGDTLTCTVTATDGLANNQFSNVVSSNVAAPITVVDRAPTAITSLDITSDYSNANQIPKNGGSHVGGDTFKLLCTLDSAVTDPDGETVSYSYRFYKYSAPTGTVYSHNTSAAVGEATGTTALVRLDEMGCAVTATSGGQSVSANSATLASTVAKQRVTVINRIPTTNAPTPNTLGVVQVVEDTARLITMNGVDADGDSLTYSIVGSPSNGDLSAISTNTVTYTPDANYNGPDSFQIQVNDGTVSMTLAQTITINVTAVNDAPYVSPIAASIVVAEDSANNNVAFTGQDADGDIVYYHFSPGSGTATSSASTAANTTANLKYSPAANFAGTTFLDWLVCDVAGDPEDCIGNNGLQSAGQIPVTVNSINDAPTVTLSSTSDTAALTAATLNGAAISISIAGKTNGGGTDESSQTLTWSNSTLDTGKVASVSYGASAITVNFATSAEVINYSITFSLTDNGSTETGCVNGTTVTLQSDKNQNCKQITYLVSTTYPPTLTSVTSEGRDGLTMSLVGSNFLSGMQVIIDDDANNPVATSLTNSTSATFVLPTLSIGSHNVKVRNSAGSTASVNRSYMHYGAPKLWYAAANGYEDTGSITWSDRSVTNATLTQGTTAPTLLNESGVFSVQFDGTQKMKSSVGLNLSLTTGMNIFTVASPDRFQNEAAILADFSGGKYNSNFILHQNDFKNNGWGVHTYSSSGSHRSEIAQLNPSQRNLLSFTGHNTAEDKSIMSHNRRDALGTSLPGITNASELFSLGNLATSATNMNLGFKGGLSEFILYSTDVGASSRASLESYLATKYGITVSTSARTDTIAPQVVATGINAPSPSGATGSVVHVIGAHFDEPVKVANPANAISVFKLDCGNLGGAPLSQAVGTAIYYSATNLLTLNLSGANTIDHGCYRAQINAGQVADMSNNTLAANYSWDFLIGTTASPVLEAPDEAEPGPVWDTTNPAVAQLWPASDSTNIPRSIREVRVKINEDTNLRTATPEVLATLFKIYRAHSCSDRGSAADVRGTVTYEPGNILRFVLNADENFSGGCYSGVVYINLPGWPNIKDIYGNQMQHTSLAPVAHYLWYFDFADMAFTPTATPAAPTNPSVISATYSLGAKGYPANAITVKVVFDKEMDLATLNVDGNLIVTDYSAYSANPQAGSVSSYNLLGRSYYQQVFIPLDNTSFEISISGVTDLSGNPLNGNFQLTPAP